MKNCPKKLKITVFQIFANFLNFLNHFWLVSEGFAGPKNEGSGSKKPIKTYGFWPKSGFRPAPGRQPGFLGPLGAFLGALGALLGPT